MRRLLPALVLLPTSALADTLGRPMIQALDLTTGTPKALLGQTMSLAWGMLTFALVLGLIVTAFGTSPTQSRDYGAVLWRFLLVLALLSGYNTIFGSVVKTCNSLAARIEPQDAWNTFFAKQEAYYQSVSVQSGPAATGSDSGDSSVVPTVKAIGGYVGGAIFDGLLLLILALGQAIQWAFAQIAQILVAVFYILGPLALVWWIPGTDSAARWFRSFVTIACWPIMMSLLVAIATGVLFQSQDSLSQGSLLASFGSLASTLLLTCLTLAVPALTSALIGGAVKNAVSPAASGVAGMAMGAAGGVAGALRGDGLAHKAAKGAVGAVAGVAGAFGSAAAAAVAPPSFGVPSVPQLPVGPSRGGGGSSGDGATGGVAGSTVVARRAVAAAPAASGAATSPTSPSAARAPASRPHKADVPWTDDASAPRTPPSPSTGGQGDSVPWPTVSSPGHSVPAAAQVQPSAPPSPSSKSDS